MGTFPMVSSVISACYSHTHTHAHTGDASWILVFTGTSRVCNEGWRQYKAHIKLCFGFGQRGVICTVHQEDDGVHVWEKRPPLFSSCSETHSFSTRAI